MHKEVVKGICIFGCGKLGRDMLKLWHCFGKQPEFMCDNNSELWGTTLDGVQVISPSELRSWKYEKIIITSSANEEIEEQLHALGINDNHIFVSEYTLEAKTLFALSDYFSVSGRMCSEQHEKKQICMIDLNNGMVLGGVERWSYQFAETVRKLGYDGQYLIPVHKQRMMVDENFPPVFLGKPEMQEELGVMESALEHIAAIYNPVVICNFPFEIFQAVCLLKKCARKKVCIIAIVHNDEDIYYQVYGLWKKELDYCLAISRKIYRRLLREGIPEEKLLLLKWNMKFPQMKRRYSTNIEPLRIGYAGRVSVTQKRIDKLIDIASTLDEKGIDFQLEIAGSGDFEEELFALIANRHLVGKVILVGLLPHEAIFGFWNRQDISISCSEYEGHSISQVEAMAMGAVPVVTNTSGAEDDIVDGWNGYIVDVDDLDRMIDRLEGLYMDREKLKEMGQKAKETIIYKNNPEAEKMFWKGLLKIS